MMSPSIRGQAVRSEIRPVLPQSKSEQRELLEDFLTNWAGPQSVKTKILKAHEQESFVLDLEGKHLNSLPDGLFLLPHLGNLIVNGNPSLKNLPPDLAYAPALARIQANDCDLHELPENIGQAGELVMLEIKNNGQLTELPASMADLKKFEVIEASRCNLVVLPEGGMGPKIRQIDLSDNPGLRHLPEIFAEGTNIEHLELKGCSLSNIPDGIGRLPKLRALNLADNIDMQQLPSGLDFKKVHVGTRGTQIRLMDLVLNQPISPQVRKEQEAKLKHVQKQWGTIQKLIETGSARTAERAEAARLEVDQGRAGLSNTAKSTPLAGRNWKAADHQMKDWIGQNHPLDTEHLKRLNALLGKGTMPFNDPDAFEKFGARFGEFRRQPTGFPQGTSAAAVVDEREVGAEMAHFDEWFEHASAQVDQGRMSPAELAAATVQRLISIHPFPDANGRTARLAGDWVLMSYGLPPVNSPQRPIIVYSSGRNPNGPDDALAWTVEGITKTVEIYEKQVGLKPSKR
ncbi:Fic family protein [Paracidovorax valerianellae]|uniref:Fic/DOC family protein n=2 Tax=Paracidovorax valerianellae TaxID=187868 RepID=A0A1G6KYG5_9BURK|nr:Fic family protein [Paracidovorax valerianellae]MDA8446539.1 Fic family protein [Paracidovorax valerianellae]SDC35987.1 Fic/DOC family protein [Paracidovorax valerianellae]